MNMRADQLIQSMLNMARCGVWGEILVDSSSYMNANSRAYLGMDGNVDVHVQEDVKDC